MQRLSKPIWLSTRFVSGARKPKAKTSTTKLGELDNGFAVTSFLQRCVGLAMTLSMETGLPPVSKAGLLIHFMLFQIPLLKFQTFNLVAKVRLIATKNRIPNLSLGFG
jgi:ABC-type uncharacterized transport system permease subunit